MRVQFILLLLIAFTGLSCSTSSDNTPTNTGTMSGNGNGNGGGNTGPLYMGVFVDVAHPTSGVASVNQDKTVLSLTNFMSDSGPILELYLATNPDAGNYISLGELKGYDGDYDYDLPADVNFNTHTYVIVWCVDFAINFGHAVLQ